MEQIKKIDFHINQLDLMKKYPSNLYYIGNLELLKKKKIAIVGSRHPGKYAREMTYELTNKLSQNDNIIISGGAIGIDTIAHKTAKTKNSIMVAGTGLDIHYPSINKNMIKQIEQKGLILSQFPPKTPSLPRNFAIRNEIIVALSDILVVAYADIKSGSMRSIEYALKMKKKIYVFPHRIGESEGTNKILAQGKAEAIYSIDDFIIKYIDDKILKNETDSFLKYFKTNPTYDEAIIKYGQKVFEYEILGKITIENGRIRVI